MPRNLLLADDSITIQKVVGITFAGEDFNIVAVDNGDDAVRKAREIRPDLILADVVMPKKNGYEVCEAVKNDPELAHIPVLLLAGTFEAFDESRARAARADAHIAKPFESQALINKVRELLEHGATVAEPKSATASPSDAKVMTPGPPAIGRPAAPSSTSGSNVHPAPGWASSVATASNPSAKAPFRGPMPSTPAAPPSVSAGTPGGSTGPGAGGASPFPLRSTAPVLTRQAPPSSSQLPSTAARSPEIRDPQAPAANASKSVPRPVPEESFELLWSRDEVPLPSIDANSKSGSAELPQQPRATPERKPVADLDWAALGFETDAAARSSVSRMAEPEGTKAGDLQPMAWRPTATQPLSGPPPIPPAPAQARPTPGPHGSVSPTLAGSPATPSTFASEWTPSPIPVPSSASGPVVTEGGAERSRTPYSAVVPHGAPVQPQLQPGASVGRSPSTPSTTSDILAFGEPMNLADLEIEEPVTPEAVSANRDPLVTVPPPSGPPASTEMGGSAPVRPREMPSTLAVAATSATQAVMGDGGEALLREALSKASREVIERIAWEIVPTLAETIIREHLERLIKQREN